MILLYLIFIYLNKNQRSLAEHGSAAPSRDFPHIPSSACGRWFYSWPDYQYHLWSRLNCGYRGNLTVFPVNFILKRRFVMKRGWLLISVAALFLVFGFSGVSLEREKDDTTESASSRSSLWLRQRVSTPARRFGLCRRTGWQLAR